MTISATVFRGERVRRADTSVSRNPNATVVQAARSSDVVAWLDIRPVIAIGLIAVAALSFRLWGLDADSLDMDEITQVAMYRLGLRGIVIPAAVQGQPPLDYWIGWGLQRLGLAQSDWWVRFPAAVFGAGGVFLLGWWVRRMAGTFAGVAAALLLAVCPLHVVMSQQARPYTIFFFFALAAVLAFLHARRRMTLGVWVGFASLFLCMLMTRWTDPHFITVGLVAFAIGAWMRSRFREYVPGREEEKLRLWATVTAVGVAYAVYNPFFGVLAVHSGQHLTVRTTDYLGRVWGQWSDAFSAVFGGYSHATVFSPLPADAGVLVIASLLVALGFSAAVWGAVRRPSEIRTAFLVVLVPFSILYALVYGYAGNAIPKPQYLLFLSAPVVTCAAIAAETLRGLIRPFRRVVRMTAFLAMVGLAAVPMTRASVHALRTADKWDWRGVMGYLKEHSRPGDRLAVIATDTVPSTYHVAAYGRLRYGREDMQFLNIDLNARVDALDHSQWARRDTTVWIVGYNDRMYLGYDQLPTPAPTTADTRVHPFSGLFIMELPPGEPAAARLLGGLARLYEQVPDGRSLIAPAIFCGRCLWARGNEKEAAASFDAALRQCRSKEEAAVLMHDYIAPLTEGLALHAGDGVVSQREP